MPFSPGKSGNPYGRPRGIRDRRTSLRDLLEPHAPQLVAKAVEPALAGDSSALRLCIDRLIPPAACEDAGMDPLPVRGPTAGARPNVAQRPSLGAALGARSLL